MRYLLTLLLLVCGSFQADGRDLQDAILSRAPTADAAVIPITAWSTNWTQPNAIRFTVVVGTGFLVDRDGHFVSAAHVVNTKKLAGIDVELKATIRQKDGSGTGQPFKIVDIDADHDLALCQIDGFKVFTPERSPFLRSMKLPGRLGSSDVSHTFASLRIANSTPLTGRLVLVSGFPLGSWTPTIQLGLVSSTHTLYPPPSPPMGVPKGSHDLLQISVNANHGNSGGPIIDLSTGDVIGVLLQLVPAPIAIGGQLHYNAGTFEMSGLMLAAPAAWVNALLQKNNVHSESVRAGRLVIWR